MNCYESDEEIVSQGASRRSQVAAGGPPMATRHGVVQDQEEGIFLKPKASDASRTWESIIGCAHYVGPRKTLREMDEAVMEEARSRK